MRTILSFAIIVGNVWFLLMLFRVPLTAYRTYLSNKGRLSREINEIEKMYKKQDEEGDN